MSFIINSLAGKAAVLGFLAGMRTSAALVISTYILSHYPSKELNGTVLNFMRSEKAAAIFKIMAVGELVGDKLPDTPNRIKPAGLTGRCISGALAGASVYKAVGYKALTGGIISGATAAISTFGTFFLRKTIVKTTRIPDLYVGAMEDALVIGMGLATINNKLS